MEHRLSDEECAFLFVILLFILASGTSMEAAPLGIQAAPAKVLDANLKAAIVACLAAYQDTINSFEAGQNQEHEGQLAVND